MADKQKILVMDDEVSICKALSIILSMSGYECISAKDGREAIEVYKKHQLLKQPIAAVILDLNVPVGLMSGKDAAKELLTMDEKVKLIASSGDSQDEAVTNFKKFGFCAVLVKPYDIEQLKATLETTIKEV